MGVSWSASPRRMATAWRRWSAKQAQSMKALVSMDLLQGTQNGLTLQHS